MDCRGTISCPTIFHENGVFMVTCFFFPRLAAFWTIDGQITFVRSFSLEGNHSSIDVPYDLL